MNSQNFTRKGDITHICKCCGLIEGAQDKKQDYLKQIDEKSEIESKIESDEQKGACCENEGDKCHDKKLKVHKAETETNVKTKENHEKPKNVDFDQKDITLCSPKKNQDQNERYVIKDMIKLYASSDLFRPHDPPKHTQTTVAKYLVRADGHDLEYTDRDPHVTEPISNLWVERSKESWVPRVGEDAVKLHEVFKKYGQRYDYNPAKFPKKLLFPRPYSLDLECLEEYRRQGIEKCLPKHQYKCVQVQPRQNEQSEGSFKFQPPFWWLADERGKRKPRTFSCTRTTEDDEDEKRTYKLRWRPLVDLSKNKPERDWCQRRLEMAKVGAPFKHEACNIYYKNYPSPKSNKNKI